MSKSSQSDLSPELKALVHEVSDLWGQTIKEEAGPVLFNKIENLRKFLTQFRNKTSDLKKSALLKTLQNRMEKLSSAELELVVHSFSVLLELTNLCENVVRSNKIRKSNQSQDWLKKPNLKKNDISLVLTAHPTESRAPEMVQILHQVQRVLLQSTYQGETDFSIKLLPLFRQIWHLRMARKKSPEVHDEADYIYSLLFRPETLAVLLGKENRNIMIHTWVGGDKDGHTGVDEQVMLESLQSSRSYLLSVLYKLSIELEQELLRFVKLSSTQNSKLAEKSFIKLRQFIMLSSSVERIKEKDGVQVSKIQKAFDLFTKSLSPTLKRNLIGYEKINSLFRLFPFLVVPLELRESSDVLREFKDSKNKSAIFKMLLVLRSISEGSKKCGYAKSFIISMTESAQDMQIAESFVHKALGKKLAIPIVPLFEQNKDLAAGPQIMLDWLRLKKIKTQEIMLGYSDSSKQAGVWPSRLAIHEAMKSFENLKNKIPNLTLTYFHGSGGSVDRGGGSLEDQTSYWPKTAFERYKVTIQGEMIQRTFATSEIFDHNLTKIEDLGSKPHPGFKTVAPVLKTLSENISTYYKASLSDSKFLDMVGEASAYRFLEQLKFGSRPSKRKKLEGINSLRAIPWILAWTQTRVLLPLWWGLGTGYSKLNRNEKAELKILAQGKDAQFKSYIHQLGFTLAKVEMPIWNMYLDRSKLSEEEKQYFKDLFKNEHLKVLKAFRELTGQSELLPDKPWLEQSIRLRSPFIHPLNVAQIIAAENKNWPLLRECSVGIACGMVTTG